MKHKILIAGQNNSLIDNFFVHLLTSFEFMTTSERILDIQHHLERFKPDLFLVIPKNESPEAYKCYTAVSKDVRTSNIRCGLIGSEEEIKKFRNSSTLLPDIIIDSANPLYEISDNLESFIEAKDRTGVYIASPEARARLKDANEDNLVSMHRALAEKGSKNIDTDDLREMSAVLDQVMGKTSKIKESIRRAAAGESLNRENLQSFTRDKDAGRNIAYKKPAPGAKPHILVVDDDPLMLRAIKEQLKGTYDVGTAVNGRVAMRFLESKTTDLILLDYEMPEENGAQVLEKLRAGEHTRSIPVVFLTGIADSDKIRQILAYHPQGYLLKPINHDKLLSTINNVFYGG